MALLASARSARLRAFCFQACVSFSPRKNATTHHAPRFQLSRVSLIFAPRNFFHARTTPPRFMTPETPLREHERRFLFCRESGDNTHFRCFATNLPHQIASPLPASPHGTARKRPLRKVAGVLLSTDQYTIHRRRLLVKFVRARGRARALCVHIPFARAPSPARGLQLLQADGHLRRAFDSGVPGGEKGAEPRASRHTGRRGCQEVEMTEAVFRKKQRILADDVNALREMRTSVFLRRLQEAATRFPSVSARNTPPGDTLAKARSAQRTTEIQRTTEKTIVSLGEKTLRLKNERPAKRVFSVIGNFCIVVLVLLPFDCCLSLAVFCLSFSRRLRCGC